MDNFHENESIGENKSSGPVIRVVVTTALNYSKSLRREAEIISQHLNVPFVKRSDRGLQDIKKEFKAEHLLVVGRGKISLSTEDKEFFFHQGMAKLRINEICNGKTDQMIKAMDIKPGDTILDCTLGLGTDALVASYVTGPEGKITALEGSPWIAYIVKDGLQKYKNTKNIKMQQAAKNIEVISENHLDFLLSAADSSYDIVYFDPMFRRPMTKPCAMNTMRAFTNSSPLKVEAISQAVRVARKRVVIKESRDSGEFERLGIKNVQGGKYSQVAYGIIVKGRDKYEY